MRKPFAPLFALITLVALASCGTAGMTTVQGAGPNDLLKLRAGPGLGYNILLGLPDGTPLRRHGCVTELGQSWCKVSLTTTPNVTGYVSADYLSPPAFGGR
ncbi:hypothetical protein BVG79_p1000169 (plasmid) [Ketogulonicigenium robustum]|uniref:SH3b domain-containing protein n=1 Tax=Ketogulonicigenium robustum TaxID=92947 RepID=A0A1W6P3K7_9RHOB|nr:SH3 domain-containing protein [Ketogulonicigenium robustum]ARO15971.1 hypothetical protein BVG79_p1000169 [Ketogulonicigenium robustum]